jgi:hypothetical protein
LLCCCCCCCCCCWGDSHSPQYCHYCPNSPAMQYALSIFHHCIQPCLAALAGSLGWQFVCLFVNTRPARDADVFSDYTGTILQASIIIPSTRPTFLSGLGQNPKRGPTATRHLSLPGLRYKTLLTTCQTYSPVEV